MLQGNGVVAKAIVGCKIWFPYGSVGSIPTTRTIQLFSTASRIRERGDTRRSRRTDCSRRALSGRPMSGRGRKLCGAAGPPCDPEKNPLIKRETVELVRRPRAQAHLQV